MLQVLHVTARGRAAELSMAKGADLAWPTLSSYGLSASQAAKSDAVYKQARKAGVVLLVSFTSPCRAAAAKAPIDRPACPC
jgi:hypothetical protein